MTGWIDVLIAAFTLQLLVLPGEKGQIIIASLSTKYNPYAVVAGAATAFGGWTAIEIALGNALKGSLPEVYLDGITALLFIVFAVLLIKTVPSNLDGASDEVTDGGTHSRFDLESTSVPSSLHGFVSSFSIMVFGEFGDKTQFVTISLAVQYGAHPAIWFGEMLAIVPVSLLTALFFDRISEKIDTTWIHWGAATVFVVFAADITSKHLLGISFLPL